MSACTGETPRLNILRSSVDERVTTLSRLVSLDLTSPAATKNQIQEDISRLLRLGLGDQARDIYLTSRSSTIKHRLRQLQFNGDIVSYMIDYSEVFFRLIKNTCEWFGISFHDASMASGFMKWIQKELELLISGVPDIDIDDWKNNTEYRGYSSTSPQVQWFWRAIRSFDQEERAKLLQFATGTSKVPLEGFKALSGVGGKQKFQIHKDFGAVERLPSAH